MDPQWISVKALVVRAIGILLVALLGAIFTKALWTRKGDTAFTLALVLFFGGLLWSYAAVLAGGLDEVLDFWPCYDLRGTINSHVEIVWGPSILASAWLLWVVFRSNR